MTDRTIASALLIGLLCSATSCNSSIAHPASSQSPSPTASISTAATTVSPATTATPSQDSPGQLAQQIDSLNFVAPVLDYKVIERYPHDKGAFTQGLVYRGNDELWESTGLVGKSSLRRVQLKTGKVLQKVEVPEPYFAEGLCHFQGQLILLTWQNHQSFICSPQTLKLGKKIAYDLDGWGITAGITKEGKKLLLTSDGSEEICWREPTTLKTVGRFKVTDGTRPVYNLNELEWIEGKLWANVWGSPYIAIIDPYSGQVQSWLDCRGLLSPQESQGSDVLNGIAYDSENHRIFITGKLWPKLFQVEFDTPR